MSRKAYVNKLHMLLDWSSLACLWQTVQMWYWKNIQRPVQARHDIFYSL